MKYGLIILLIICSMVAHAQKPPNKQEASIWAPVNVKIDGVANEWGKLQAHNNATDISYTLANDEQNLYFVVQAKQIPVISKIVAGGIRLKIQLSEDKNPSRGINISYPAYPAADGKTSYYVSTSRRADTSKKALDSLMWSNNQILDQKCKWIKITGVAALDSIISVYNENGIKTAQKFDRQKTYTQEIAIPLKYLNLTSDQAKFSYQIIVNGSKIGNPAQFETLSQDAGMRAFQESFQNQVNFNAAKQASPTDFHGEYTLAKKP